MWKLGQTMARDSRTVLDRLLARHGPKLPMTAIISPIVFQQDWLSPILLSPHMQQYASTFTNISF